MTTITTELPSGSDHQAGWTRRTRAWANRLAAFKPGSLHASVIVTGVVAFKAFQMSYSALHNLARLNMVEPALASNVPIAIDGLMVGSIIATASFPRLRVGWWYATALFALSTLVSVVGNIEYAHEIGGHMVAVAIYAGMPLTMMFAVHLTLMLWGRGWTGRVVAIDAVGDAVPDLDIDHETFEFAHEFDTNEPLQVQPAPAPGPIPRQLVHPRVLITNQV
jgi:hypothetical protein